MIDGEELRRFRRGNNVIFEHRKSMRSFEVMFANPGYVVAGFEAFTLLNNNIKYKKVFEKELLTEKDVGEFIEDMLHTKSWSNLNE